MNDKSDYNVKNVFFGITLSGILVISILIYGFLTEHHLLKKFIPLVNIASKIRIEVTTAHLWFEEVISGDKEASIETVRKNLLLAKNDAKSMLDGGENDIYGEIIPLSNRFLRREMGKVVEKLNELINITEERYKNHDKSGIGSSIDQKYDEIFKAFLKQTENVEGNLISEVERQRINFERSHLILILICLFLIIFILYQTIIFNIRRVQYFNNIKKTNDDLQRALSEVKTLQGIIPICSYCNKIRDREGLWNQLEVYIHEHSNAEFSHGICPHCYEKQMKEFKSKI